MTSTQTYRIWETGSKDLPPPKILSSLQPPEQLLWGAEVPVSRFLKRWLWLVVVSSALTLLFAYEAPWGLSVAEYCADSQGRSCQKFYFLAWPGVIVFAYLAVHFLMTLWRAKSAHWVIQYGISTDAAIVISGDKPPKVHRTKLDGSFARVDWFASVKFNKSRQGLSFAALDLPDAERAVYWSNEGRLLAEFQEANAP